MVKNIGGGNKSKKNANKNMAPNRGLHMATENGEVYAIVSKIFGNGMCEAYCVDGVSRLCIIRQKFKGRFKKDNAISVGVWILVGIREWEVRKDGTQKTDLLTVYNDNDKDKLISKSTINLTSLIIKGNSLIENTDDVIGINIVKPEFEKYENIIEKDNNSTIILEEYVEVDIDDI
jgi:translation initiation factor 1A